MSKSVSIDESIGVSVEITRKRIRHMYIRIDSRSRRVRVSAPFRMTDAQVRDALRLRAGWILEKVNRVALPPADGDSVDGLLFGEPVRMRVLEVERRRSITMESGVLTVRVRRTAVDKDRSALIASWRRTQVEARIPEMIARWEPVLGVQVAEWRVRRMRTRWGTCNIDARRIWLNLDLIRFPIECLEYVVVHEMVHLLERRHNRRFYALMDQYLPDWRAARAILRQSAPTD